MEPFDLREIVPLKGEWSQPAPPPLPNVRFQLNWWEGKPRTALHHFPMGGARFAGIWLCKLDRCPFYSELTDSRGTTSESHEIGWRVSRGTKGWTAFWTCLCSPNSEKKEQQQKQLTRSHGRGAPQETKGGSLTSASGANSWMLFFCSIPSFPASLAPIAVWLSFWTPPPPMK